MSWFGNLRLLTTALELFIFLVLKISLLQATGNNCGSQQIPNELIIKFDKNFTFSETTTPDRFRSGIPLLDSLILNSKIEEIIQLSHSQSIRDPGTISVSGFRFIFSDTLNFLKILPRLNQNQLIEFAEPNYCYWAAGHPPPTGNLLADLPLEKLNLAKVRQLKNSIQPVVVGLIDAGFEPTPPGAAVTDAGNFSDWLNPDEIIYLNDTPPLNSDEPNPQSQHGFLLGSLVRRVFSEMKTPIPPALKIIPISAGAPTSERCLQLTATNCAAAIDYAVLQQAKILLLGWSGSHPSRLLQNSINRAFRQGVFVIAAAGNQNQKTPAFPAAWPNVLAVAATDLNDLKSTDSNFGDWVDVSAPGNFSKKFSQNELGTSAAAAIVAGLAALIQSAEGTLAPDSLTRRIVYTCDNIDSLNPHYRGQLGVGRVNALRAIKKDFQPNFILREQKFDRVAADSLEKLAEPNSARPLPFKQRLSLLLENTAADAWGISVAITGLPESVQVTPVTIQFSDFKFRQTRLCEFWVQSPAELSGVRAQIKVTAKNSFYRSIPVNVKLPFANYSPRDSVVARAQTQPEHAAQPFRQFDFMPEKISVLPATPTSPTEIFVAGTAPSGKINGAIWNPAQPSNSFDLPLDSLMSHAVFFADLNADGRPDLCAGIENSWRLFQNQGTHFSGEPAAILPTALPFSSQFFDLNFDGFPEILTRHSQFTIYRNLGHWKFVTETPGSLTGFNQFKIIDLNADGILDLIGLPDQSKPLQIYWGNDSSFLSVTPTNLEIPASHFELLPLDANFSTDLLVVSSNPWESQLKIFSNLSGGFVEQQNLIVPPVQQILTGDLDDDHNFDLLLLHPNHAPQIFLNDGHANFSAAPFSFTDEILAAGILLDFDNDGALDLAGIKPQNDRVEIYLNAFSIVSKPETPVVPQNLTHKTDSTHILLRWEAPETDAARGLTYELRLSTDTLVAEKIISDNFAPGNLGQSHQFQFKAEPGKKYFWTVRTVEAAFRHSGWAPVQSVRLPTPPPQIFEFWPRADTTLVRGDSLRFRVNAGDAGSDTLKFFWRTKCAQTGHNSVFTYHTPTRRQLEDSVWVSVANRETSIRLSWKIKIQWVNRPPEILAKFPAQRSLTVNEGDSLEFKIHARDTNQDSLTFQWLNVSRKGKTVQTDSLLRVKWDYFSAGPDSLGVRVADSDTAIECWWQVFVQNTNQPPEIIRWFPRSDTTLFTADSLKIRLEIFEPDRQPVSISWEKNGAVLNELAGQFKFNFLAPENLSKKDTIVARISDGDTTLLKQWIISSRKKNHCPQIIHFWPQQDTLLVAGDSLEFRAYGFDKDADLLNYSWRVNRRTFLAFDSLFRYQATFFPPGIDTVEICIADGDTLARHIWRVQIKNLNTAPSAPKPLFPRQSEIVLESGNLLWRSAKDPDPEDKRLTYFVRIASDSNFATICTADSVKTDTVLALSDCRGFQNFESGKIYFWQVRAVDCSRDTSCIFPKPGCFRFQHVSARILRAYGKNNGDGGITIFWETAQERGNLGFNILRKTSPKGEFVRVNEMLIRGTSPYSCLDNNVQAGESYFYCVECVSITGLTFRHEVIEVSAPVPETFALHQNYPNPLTFETFIRFQIPRECHISLSVYNILGEEVRTLVKETREKGFYDIIWDGRDENGREVGSGVYFYSITAENFHETRKIMVVR